MDKAKADGEAALEREIERNKSLPEEGTRPKWKFKFRIHSDSHSIRPKAFSEWNKRFRQIDLSSVSGKKNQIIVEITLLDNVPLKDIYAHAWGMARHFVAALNIATLGFFWWRFADDKTGWFDKITDQDNPKMDVKIEPTSREMEWGENRVLTADDMEKVAIAFVTLPKPTEIESVKYAAVEHYLAALTTLAASNVHMPGELTAVGHLTQALQTLMSELGEWKKGEPFEPAFRAFVDSFAADADDRNVLIDVIRAYDNSEASGKPASGPVLAPKHVVGLKALVDLYFLSKVQPPAMEKFNGLADKAA